MAVCVDGAGQPGRAGPRAKAPDCRAYDRTLPRTVRPVAAGDRRMTRFALFYHSVISDWNHGNAHFLRGLMRALQAQGHQTVCYEQADNWSLRNLLATRPGAVAEFEARFPDLRYRRYAA